MAYTASTSECFVPRVEHCMTEAECVVAFSFLHRQSPLTAGWFRGSGLVLGAVKQACSEDKLHLISNCLTIMPKNVQVFTAWEEYLLSTRFTAFIPRAGNYFPQVQEGPHGTFLHFTFPFVRWLLNVYQQPPAVSSLKKYDKA